MTKKPAPRKKRGFFVIKRTRLSVPEQLALQVQPEQSVQLARQELGPEPGQVPERVLAQRPSLRAPSGPQPSFRPGYRPSGPLRQRAPALS